MNQSTANGNGHTGDTPEATLISVILDRSGSMRAMGEPTIAGFNQFLHEQQQLADGGRALMSLTQFDDRYEVNFVGEPIENVPDLDTHSYVPRGMTALYDAIGRTIHAVEAWSREHAWKERVLVLIVTDGQENASKEYTFQAVRALIEQKEKEGWNFAYMGAHQDSYAVGGALNMRADSIANFDATLQGTAANYARMAKSASRYRLSKLKGVAAPGFFDDDEPGNADPTAGKLSPTGARNAADSTKKPAPHRSRLKSLQGWFLGKRDDERGH